MPPRLPDIDALHDGVLAGDRAMLARAITLVESTRADHQALAHTLLTRLMPSTGSAHRVGITGVPGVGKSTFIEALGMHLLEHGRRVAVLAVDPSSTRTGGSILGDKTRMHALSRDVRAFVRPSPTSGTLGGVASKTRETMLLCEAAGFDVVLVETVGVGQSELAVARMTDFFLVLMLAGAGDELQGIKRGLMEMADALVINKADGDNRQAARRAASTYRAALALMRPHDAIWRAPAMTCSALERESIDEVWAEVERHREVLTSAGQFEANRREQQRGWMWSLIDELLRAELRRDPAVAAALPDIERDVTEGRLPATAAARRILDIYRGPR